VESVGFIATPMAMIDRRHVDVNQFSGTSLAIDRSWTEQRRLLYGLRSRL